MAFDLQPNLRGNLLRLRPLEETDFDDLYAVASDRLIWEQHPNSDRYKEDVFREFFAGAIACGGAFIVIDNNTGQAIGSSRYNGYNEVASEIEIGWTFLARAYWGGAYNKEMKQLMVNHALRFVKRVVFLVGPTNTRSQKAMEKIGSVRIADRTDKLGRVSFAYEITAAL